MLLLYQTGSVKIGEIVRYTVTYTPAHDRILPSPSHLHLRIKNTSAIALRAAFVHGPYTLYAAAYPGNFNPNEKFEDPRTFGVPEFEPNLKAGGTFTTQLAVPEDVRQTAGSSDRHGRNLGREDVKSVSWIIEVSSQVIFSTSAAVHYELVLARDEKSMSLGFSNPLTGNGTPAPTPGQVSDHQQGRGAKDGHHPAQQKGVYSKAIYVQVDDTASLWNTPRMPEWGMECKNRGREKTKDAPIQPTAEAKEPTANIHGEKRQKVHLVVLTHGLHSNLGADMLYMKESIDAAAKQAKIDAKARRAKQRAEKREMAEGTGKSPKGHSDHQITDESRQVREHREEDSDDEEDEEVIVRGFSGNATRTERGIKYLGKRLARYVLAMTYPDQPFRPVTKKSAGAALSHALKPSSSPVPSGSGTAAHYHSSVHKYPCSEQQSAYKITSISFIAHSLGGLIQTYAVAYIHKHSPHFFDMIKPINFIALASPFLGLSNENPLYVKFALDFGLVGRTGQDLGLTWRAPTIARSGWGAIMGGISDTTQKKIDGETPVESKPLLRILPTGPAHIVLKKFRNRTVYSNVVNDGVVPLRTSCLLFLDWQGLGRVEKARRENGLVATVAGWGWAELTGQNTVSPIARTFSDVGEEISSDNEPGGDDTPTTNGHKADVPQPPPYATQDDNMSLRTLTRNRPGSVRSFASSEEEANLPNSEGAFSSFVKFFQPDKTPKPNRYVPKHSKIYKRSQTLKSSPDDSSSATSKDHFPKKHRGKATTGDAEHEDPENPFAPPKTSFFEAAGDLLKPPLPSIEFLINPKSRARTIFHDRVYHPEDIPSPPLKRRPTTLSLLRRSTSDPNSDAKLPHTSSDLSTRSSTKDYDDTKNTNPNKDPRDVVDGNAMKVEEKIARAYHRDLSWRKVLVSLQPDAHNNIIVRRMFANAYGWPVVKHLCDTHFSDAAVANIRDEDESGQERAKGTNEAPDDKGSETKESSNQTHILETSDRTDSETREATDEVSALNSSPRPGGLARALSKANLSGNESEAWSERDWADSADESDEDDEPSPKQPDKKSTSISSWNWTEAIAGKGALSPRLSPTGSDRKDVNSFLNKGKKLAALSPSSTFDSMAAKTPGTEDAAGVGVQVGEASAEVE